MYATYRINDKTGKDSCSYRQCFQLNLEGKNNKKGAHNFKIQQQFTAVTCSRSKLPMFRRGRPKAGRRQHGSVGVVFWLVTTLRIRRVIHRMTWRLNFVCRDAMEILGQSSRRNAAYGRIHLHRSWHYIARVSHQSATVSNCMQAACFACWIFGPPSGGWTYVMGCRLWFLTEVGWNLEGTHWPKRLEGGRCS